MTEAPPVVVGTDLSHHSDLAIREAARWADRTGAALIVAHVASENYFAMVDAGLVGAALQGHVQNLISRSAECHLLAGSPHAELIRLAEKRKAALLVVGAAGVGGVGDALFGTTVENVVRYSHGPVLVVRHGPPDSPVIFGTDFSEASQAPLLVAVEEARERSAELVLCHSLHESNPSMLERLGISTSAAKQDHDSLRRRAETKLGSLLDTLGAKGRSAVVDQAPGEALAALAAEENASLVVVGTHGRTGLKRMALGSVAASVVRRAPCSVLMVR